MKKNSAFSSVTTYWTLMLPHPQSLFSSDICSSLDKEKYPKHWCLSPKYSCLELTLSSRITLYPNLYMCLACQHFDFNRTDWFSNNLHVSSGWYLWTMGKELTTQFSRNSGGRNVWRTPKNVCVGGQGYQGSGPAYPLLFSQGFFLNIFLSESLRLL